MSYAVIAGFYNTCTLKLIHTMYDDAISGIFQGAIQGPGEFAEGLVLGVRSLFGHTVGGAAGAVSRITGAMGKHLFNFALYVNCVASEIHVTYELMWCGNVYVAHMKL
jgi:hypothetical protein